MPPSSSTNDLSKTRSASSALPSLSASSDSTNNQTTRTQSDSTASATSVSSLSARTTSSVASSSILLSTSSVVQAASTSTSTSSDSDLSVTTAQINVPVSASTPSTSLPTLAGVGSSIVGTPSIPSSLPSVVLSTDLPSQPSNASTTLRSDLSVAEKIGIGCSAGVGLFLLLGLTAALLLRKRKKQRKIQTVPDSSAPDERPELKAELHSTCVSPVPEPFAEPGSKAELPSESVNPAVEALLNSKQNHISVSLLAKSEARLKGTARTIPQGYELYG